MSDGITLDATGREHSPISIMHPNSLLPFQNPRLVRHHTRFMQRRLSIKNQDIPIAKMSVDFLVHRCGACVESLDGGEFFASFLDC